MLLKASDIDRTFIHGKDLCVSEFLEISADSGACGLFIFYGA